MKERPIIFNAEMVRAILDGRKTQTRRVVLHQPQRSDILPNLVFPRNKQESNYPPGGWIYPNGMEQILSLCPFGSIGDRLWVRETWGVVSHAFDDDGFMTSWTPDRPATAIHEMSFGKGYYSGHAIYAADGSLTWGDDDGHVDGRSCWKPSIHMPRAASRILLEVTAVRVEQLQDISENDAKSEGLAEITKDGSLFKFGIPDGDGYPGTDDNGWAWHEWERNPVDAYCKLWQSIYGEESWQANPWVWVIEFRKI